jgi:hypothetical protein
MVAIAKIRSHALNNGHKSTKEKTAITAEKRRSDYKRPLSWQGGERLAPLRLHLLL